MSTANEPYKEAVGGANPVAVRLGQMNVNAPGHETWGTVTCDQCDDKFALGQPRTTADARRDEYAARLKKILADDHARNTTHRDSYDLGW